MNSGTEKFYDYLETLPGFPLFAALGGILKTLFIIINFLLLVGFFYALVKGWKYRPQLEPQAPPARRHAQLGREIYREKWDDILKKCQDGSPDSLRLAVISADSFVDTVLRKSGVKGEHLADKLSEFSPDEYKSLEAVWKAHKTRNEMVHTPGFYLSPEDAKIILNNFQAFLTEIGAI